MSRVFVFLAVFLSLNMNMACGPQNDDGQTRVGQSILKLSVGNIKCQKCLNKIQGNLLKMTGVFDVKTDINNENNNITVYYDDKKLSEKEIKDKVTTLGHAIK